MINAHDLHALARFMVDRHGPVAVDFADRAVEEMEHQGERSRAEAWRALRSVVVDMVDGRLCTSSVTLH